MQTLHRVAGATLFLFAACLSPATAGTPKFKPKPPPKPIYTAITKIDTAAHTVTCSKMNGAEHGSETLKVDDRTEIQVNGATGKFEDLKIGMQVDITLGMDPAFASRLVASDPPPMPTPIPTPTPRPH